jgi:hypothetical protein
MNKSKIKGILSYEFLILSVIVTIGFALRYYFLGFYLSSGSTDSVGYSYAASLYSNGNWLSTAATPKGFLLISFMSLFYKIFGPTLLAGQLVSLLFGSLLPVVTFYLCLELFNKKIGLLAAFIVSINPLLILYSSLIFREMMFSFMWICSLYFGLRGFKGNTFYAILGGIFFGLASMTIEIGIFAAIGFVLFFLIQKTLMNKDELGEYKNLDVFLCSGFLTLIPLFIRDYLSRGDFFFSWVTFEYYPTALIAYISLIGLSMPYVVLFRVLFRQPRLPEINRLSKIIKISIVGSILLVTVLIVGSFSGLFSEGLPFLAAQSFTGFVKFVEYLAFPEALGVFLILLSLVGIIYGLKSHKTRLPIIFCLIVFLFTYAVRAALVSENYRVFGDYSLIQLLTWSGGLQQVTWPFQVIFRYFIPFISLFAIFASYGIFFICGTLSTKLVNGIHNRPVLENNVHLTRKIARSQIFKALLVSIMVLVVLFAYFYAQADLFARADSHDSYKNPTRPADASVSSWMREGGESFSLIDWLHSQGSPIVYSYNSQFKEIYGKDKVILLTGNENLLDIAKRAGRDEVHFIISDAFGAYSGTQFELYRAGFYERQPIFRGQPIGYYELVRSYKHWHQAQVFRISAPERMALVVQGSQSTGAPWVSLLSNSSPSYIVQTVDDEERLTEYFNNDYDLIVITEIQRYLEEDELTLLKEKVEGGTILIINGISPPYMNLEENSDWLGAQNFAEAPKDAKWNVSFTVDAVAVSSEIDLDRSYTFYSENVYSSPTGCTDVDSDATIYAIRNEDGAVVIFAKPYGNGVVIFSGVRHTHASKTFDYEPYINFIQKLLNKSW